MAHSNTNTIHTLFDIEPIGLSNHVELDDFDFDLDHESANMIFNNTDGSEDDLADIFTDPHIDDYSLITFDSIEAPQKQQLKKPASQLVTPQPKTRNTIDLHGYNPIRASTNNKQSSKDQQDIIVKNSASYGTTYNHEMFQASCSDLKKRDPPTAETRPIKKRRVVSWHESHNYNFEMYQHMNLIQENSGDESSPTSSYQAVQEGLQKLAKSRRRTELSRRQLSMQRTSSPTNVVPPRPTTQPQFTRAHQIQACLSLDAVAQKLQQRMDINGCTSTSANRAAFFSGSRGTLTNGLEQSRKQLQMYKCL